MSRLTSTSTVQWLRVWANCNLSCVARFFELPEVSSRWCGSTSVHHNTVALLTSPLSRPICVIAIVVSSHLQGRKLLQPLRRRHGWKHAAGPSCSSLLLAFLVSQHTMFPYVLHFLFPSISQQLRVNPRAFDKPCSFTFGEPSPSSGTETAKCSSPTLTAASQIICRVMALENCHRKRLANCGSCCARVSATLQVFTQE